MRIKFSPQRRDDTLVLIKNGDVLTVNGEAFDFGPLPDGGTLPAAAVDSEWFADNVQRENGELIINLILPNPVNYSPEQAFPADLANLLDGQIMLPKPLPETLLEPGNQKSEVSDEH